MTYVDDCDPDALERYAERCRSERAARTELLTRQGQSGLTCRVCGGDIIVAELCEDCTEGNDPFDGVKNRGDYLP